MAVVVSSAVLGLFIFFYALHFRHQCMAMGTNSLRRALSRAIARSKGFSYTPIGEEPDSPVPDIDEDELLEEALRLRRRLGLAAATLTFLTLLSGLAGWLISRTWQAASYPLFGLSCLGAFLSVSSLLIRDLLSSLVLDLGG